MATLIRFAHPPADVACAAAISGDAANAGFVTLCMDHEKGRCARDPCRCCYLAAAGHGLLSHTHNFIRNVINHIQVLSSP